MPSSASGPSPAAEPPRTGWAVRLAAAACGTAAGVWLLCLTEEFTPAGSPVGWLALLLILSSHLMLLPAVASRIRSAVTPPGSSGRLLEKVPLRVTLALALILVLAGSATLTYRHHAQIAERPLLPEASAQLGLLTQVSARLERGLPLFTPPYRVGDWSQRNAFPGLLAAVYTLPRQAGYEWRYASLAAIVLLGGLVVAALAHAAAGGIPRGRHVLLLLGAAAASGSWLIHGRFLDFLHWGHAAPLWPLVFLFGWALGAGWAIVAAASAGLLAAMNPGWLLLLPLAGLALWREARGREHLFLLMLVLPPLLSYGYTRGEWEAMWTGMTGTLFQAGAEQYSGATAWRFPTIHGLTDLLALRIGLYGIALAGLVLLGRRMLSSNTGRERPILFCAAAALVVAFAPAAYFFHWAAHALLLAGTALGLAAPRSAGDSGSALPPLPRSVFAGAAAAALLLGIGSIHLVAGFPGALNRPESGHRQDHFQYLLAGFNIPSEDHVWGSKPRMATAFVLDRPTGGILEISLAAPGGEFTPFNPALIRVNGLPVGLFRERPGRSGYAIVPLRPGEVHAGVNIVEIEAAWARSPRSLNLADDERDISLMYRGLRFLPDSLIAAQRTEHAQVE